MIHVRRVVARSFLETRGDPNMFGRPHEHRIFPSLLDWGRRGSVSRQMRNDVPWMWTGWAILLVLLRSHTSVEPSASFILVRSSEIITIDPEEPLAANAEVHAPRAAEPAPFRIARERHHVVGDAEHEPPMRGVGTQCRDLWEPIRQQGDVPRRRDDAKLEQVEASGVETILFHRLLRENRNDLTRIAPELDRTPPFVRKVDDDLGALGGSE